MGAK
ncbi:hypothetical protein TF3313_1067 [Tannerella forsythia 3313]|jgi:hypothetical protein